MNRRTLLATVGGTTLVGTAGCYGIAQMIIGNDEETDESGDENPDSTGGSKNGTERPQTASEESEGNVVVRRRYGRPGQREQRREQRERTEQREQRDCRLEPTGDATETIDVTDHGLDISDSPEPGVDKDITCYGTFEVGEFDLRKVRIDAVALAENGDRIDHGWIPYEQAEAGSSYDVEIPFYVNSDEIAEYLIGATEAQYAD